MIAIITYSDYPDATPGAIRYATFAQTYVDMGFEVVLLNKSSDRFCHGVRAEAIAKGNKYKRFLLFSYNAIKTLKRISRNTEIDGVIIGADVSSFHAFVIKLWCRTHNIKCIFDATEWYSKEQFARWFTSKPYWGKEFLNRFVINKHSRVIAISSYLYCYFKGKGCKVTQIPIVYNSRMDNESRLFSTKSDHMLKIIYAGSHLLMDNIPLIVKALSLVPEPFRNKIQIYLYGFEESRIKSYVSSDVLKLVKDSLFIMGCRPHSEVMEAYITADFSILLRNPSLRVNKAGFPSKVVESMRIGVPVICNYSSDLKSYLRHKENSIIVDDLDAGVVSDLLLELVNMSQLEKEKLGYNAMQTIQEELKSQLFEDKFRYIVS